MSRVGIVQCLVSLVSYRAVSCHVGWFVWCLHLGAFFFHFAFNFNVLFCGVLSKFNTSNRVLLLLVLVFGSNGNGELRVEVFRELYNQSIPISSSQFLSSLVPQTAPFFNFSQLLSSTQALKHSQLLTSLEFKKTFN